MSTKYSATGSELPINSDLNEDKHQDRLLRRLDCATIEYMHETILERYKADMANQGYSNFQLFDSTRGAFSEGGPAFSGAGIMRKSHIQICIRNMNCIKGFFIPRNEVLFP